MIILVKSYETNQPTNMATELQSTSSTGSYVVNFDDYGAQQSSTYDTQNTKGYNPSMEEFQFVPTSASQGKCLNQTRCEFHLSEVELLSLFTQIRYTVGVIYFFSFDRYLRK